jgi:COP9 signalosome complex subunit 4
LSPAGDNKYKLMSALHKDERSKLMDPHFEIMHKIFMGNVVRLQDVKEFDKQLKEHQKVRGQDGYTVLQKALLEHNIVVLSKIYLNISFEQIGKFLDIDKEMAETIIGDMITQHRIKA